MGTKNQKGACCTERAGTHTAEDGATSRCKIFFKFPKMNDDERILTEFPKRIPTNCKLEGFSVGTQF
jgi:hypothetical protein